MGADGRRPSTAAGQLAALAVLDVAGLDVVGDGDDFAGADEDSDEDEEPDEPLELEPFVLEPLAARLSVR